MTAEWKEVPIEEEVERVVALRASGDTAWAMSEKGGLTGQFEGHGMTLYETLLGHWLYQSGRYDLAAKILMPGLETYARDRDFLDGVRVDIGTIQGYHMLVAFAGDRDYDEALRRARLIVDRFPRTGFSRYAAELAKQLPRRREDFGQLRLPTPDEWQALRANLSREEVIHYLCRRLRLLNGCQWGQPGGISFSIQQYAEPGGMERNASWCGEGGYTEVINPYVELVGRDMLGDPIAGKGTVLTMDDIPLLAPYLREDWYFLAVEFWRDFDQSRHLIRTREVIAGLINNAAGYDISRIDEFENLDKAGIETRVQEVVAWAERNRNRSESERALDVLAGADSWMSVRGALSRIKKHKMAEAVPLLLTFLDREETHEVSKREILAACRELDEERTARKAAEYLDATDPGTQLLAGMMVYRWGDRQAAVRALASALDHGDRGFGFGVDFVEAVAMLLKGGSEEEHEAARIVLTKRYFTGTDWCKKKIGLIRAFAESGRRDGYEYVLRELENKKKGGSVRVEGKEVPYTNAEATAKALVECFVPAEEGTTFEYTDAPEAKQEKIARLKKWVEERLVEVGNAQ